VRREVTLRGAESTYTLDALVYGIWAVTPVMRNGWEQLHGRWTVTHIPSGCTATGFRHFTYAQARDIAKRYAAELTEDFWEGVREDSEIAEELHQRARKIREEVAGS